MIKVWRLVKEKHAAGAFSGEGARIAGGRWNQEGTSAVYTSSTLSLAVLESIVHLDEDERDLKFVYYTAEIPEKVHIKRVVEKELPINWRAEPPANSVKNIGTAIIKSGEYAVIEFPSVIVPEEINFIINPLHPDFKKIKISTSHPYQLDMRIT